MKSVTSFRKCSKILVKEFIVNISKDYDNKRSKEFRKSYVRGRCVDFSPEIINRFFGRSEEEQAEVEVSDNVICREITTKQVKEWPRKGKLSAGCLSVKYVVLHRIGVVNWVPTNNTSNIATRLAFPSLIYGVILSQHPSILISSDVACKRDHPLSLHYRLFTEKHVPNIVMTFGKKPTISTTRKGILAELKDTCKTLDDTIKVCTERKSRLEILIKDLSEEEAEGNLEGDNAGEEDASKEDANEEDLYASDDEETTNNDED
ncbi:uncharacterized protein LOC127078802 [Lathyrus oleraceus]|uniref:uncharacterized protein LOC127078802 n=1 Tax=Pisum sativum TaxID=3888 RepID=UPI0021D311D7|nr:uncharacterized protein LOC127078802 [Pisum sativum]